jgi:hypothetical protein
MSFLKSRNFQKVCDVSKLVYQLSIGSSKRAQTRGR